MKIEYQVFLVGFRGHPQEVAWNGKRPVFNTEALALVAIRERIEWDKPRHNDFRYTVLPIYSRAD